MDTRHLKKIITVCECRNMTRAAGLLFMTQPSVSQAIAELEKDYGVRLFERLNHKLYLTAAGERLRSYASHILNLSDQVKKRIIRSGSGRLHPNWGEPDYQRTPAAGDHSCLSGSGASGGYIYPGG